MIEFDAADADRYPTLSEHGLHMLAFLREHAYAPIFRNRAGNRLTTEDLARVQNFEAGVRAARIDWRPGAPPAWLAGFIRDCYSDVPQYRASGATPGKLEDVPPIRRADFASDIASFVPDNVATDRLINFRTSGTTGHPLLVPSHPVVAASYLAFHKRALQRFGVKLENGQSKVGLALLGFQCQCFTYASVTPSMNESGFVKINLHPDDWRDASDRARYLDALQPEMFSGDPISYAALLELPLTWKPRALLSTSMTLLPALRAQLEARFECPVLDVYSMNEAGPVAVYDARAGGHVLLQPRMFVEILDDAGNALPPGERGEITLTGGFNFCLPLLRYRTGDYAALDFCSPEPVLIGLTGRPPVRFRTANGEWINNIELTHALRRFALHQFRAHQNTDGHVHFEYAAASVLDNELTPVLRQLFGDGLPFAVSRTRFEDAKVVQYSSDLQ